MSQYKNRKTNETIVSKIGIFRCILCTFYSEIGGPHEDLAILKDWGFNLRFLMRIDISLLPDYLAHCHIRVTDPGLEGMYGKMEFAGFTSHVEFESQLRYVRYREDFVCKKLGMDAY